MRRIRAKASTPSRARIWQNANDDSDADKLANDDRMDNDENDDNDDDYTYDVTYVNSALTRRAFLMAFPGSRYPTRCC